MRPVRAFVMRVVGTLTKRRSDRDFAEELESHVQLHTEENIRAGMSPEEARRAALLALGGIGATAELLRDRRGLPLIESVAQDLRFAARSLLRTPGFTVVAILTIALGVGADTAIFSVADAVLLRPLPFPEPERLVLLTSSMPSSPQSGFSVADYEDIKARSGCFEHVGGFHFDAANFGTESSTDSVPVAYVGADFFAALGARPSLGRTFLGEEDRPGAARVAVVSHDVWAGRLGADPNVVGRTVALDGESFEVIGVMPPGFRLYSDIDVWLPMGLWPYSRDRGNHWSLYAVARLGPGVTPEAARSEVSAVAAALRRDYPASNADRGAAIVGLHEDMVGEVRSSLRLLLAAVGFVLLIACANVANLLLARGAARGREIAVRAALGAGRARIVRQLLTESAVLALCGGALGVVCAYCVVGLVARAAGSAIPRADELGAHPVDPTVLAFSLGVCLLAVLVFGLAPALRAARPVLASALKDGDRGGSTAKSRLRDALVILEVALALVLLVGAGLMVKSVSVLRGGSVGYDPARVLAVGISFPRGAYRSDADKVRYAERALERVRALPGVEHASFSYPLPVFGMAWGMFYTVEGEPTPEPGRGPESRLASVSPDFFATLRIPVLAGREFAESDADGAQPVAVVDESLAAAHWPGESPIGKRLTIAGDLPRTIVGVVGAVKNQGLAEAPRPQIYVPCRQPVASSSFVPSAYVTARIAAEPGAFATEVREAVAGVDSNVAASKTRTMDELLDRTISQRRFFVGLMQLFSGLALVLTAVGVYGVIAYSVSQRTREIGVRLALGASRGDVMRLVVGEGARLALAGIAVGLVGALALSRLLDSVLFGVSATDPGVYVGIALLLLGVALAACCVPAMRATRVDPLAVLTESFIAS